MTTEPEAATPPPPPIDLFDVMGFLASIGHTPETAAEVVKRIAGRPIVASAPEVHLMTVMAERLLAMVEAGSEHVLVMNEIGWSMEHALACRSLASMTECWFHRQARLMRQADALETYGEGRHKLVRLDDHMAIGPVLP